MTRETCVDHGCGDTGEQFRGIVALLGVLCTGWQKCLGVLSSMGAGLNLTYCIHIAPQVVRVTGNLMLTVAQQHSAVQFAACWQWS